MTKLSSSRSKTQTQPNCQTIQVENALIDFIEQVRIFAKSGTELKCYRGQRNSMWENIPGLLRPNLDKLEANEKRAVRDLVSVHPDEFARDNTMFDRLVRMQHFGLPTRLLDVSLNPLVALYFAADSDPDDEPSDGVVTAFKVPPDREKYYDSDAVSCIANLANMTRVEKQEIIAIRASRQKGATKNEEIGRANTKPVYKRLCSFIMTEKPYFLANIHPVDLFKPYYVHPKMSNRRILAQAGGFIIHGLKPPRTIRFNENLVETRFIIPKMAKSSLRKDLELLGITESNLFPEIEKAAKRIKSSYSKT